LNYTDEGDQITQHSTNLFDKVSSMRGSTAIQIDNFNTMYVQTRGRIVQNIDVSSPSYLACWH